MVAFEECDLHSPASLVVNGVNVSFTFDSDIKERVRAATDIVDLIGSRFELRRQGRNYAALCPWHTDSRPSLQINPEKQIWKCWVCDIGGDVFNFVMRDEGLTFPEALKQLAERAGIELTSTKTPTRRYSKSTADAKAEMYRVLEWADKFFHRCLNETDDGQAARKYLIDRGMNEESIDSFGIGLAPDGWQNLLNSASEAKFSRQLLEAAGLIKRGDRGGHYDFFRKRVMFPVRDRESRVIAFGGRILPGSKENAKYINSPETRVFQKSRQLYGLDMAHKALRQSKQALVMEGYTDVITAHQFGIDNAVAVLGTAVGQPHLKLLRNYCDSVILLLDGDEAGQRRSGEILELFLHAQLDVRILTLPDGMDPADFLMKNGADELRGALDTAVDALEFKMRRVTTGFDPLVDTHRANLAVEDMLSLLAKVPHTGVLSNEAFRIRQNQVLPRLARKFSIPEQSLREQLTALRKRQSRYKREDKESEPNQRLMRPGDLSPFERELLELIIVAPQVAPIALERVQSGWLECEASRQMLDAYQQLEFSGQSLEFEQVLVALENPSLKSLLVTLHEQANAKLRYTNDSPEVRLRDLTHRMGEQQDVVRQQRQVTALEEKQRSESEKLDLLQDVIRQARLRQGLVENSANKEVPSTIDSQSATVASDVPAPEHPIEQSPHE